MVIYQIHENYQIIFFPINAIDTANNYHIIYPIIFLNHQNL